MLQKPVVCMNKLPTLNALEHKNISTELTGTDLDFPSHDGRGGLLKRPEGTRAETSLTALGLSLAHLGKRLDALPSAAQLPLCKDPLSLSNPGLVCRERWVNRSVWYAISCQARQYHLSPLTVLLSCYAEVLSVWSAEADVAVNLTLFDRPTIEGSPGDETPLCLVAYRPIAGESWGAAMRRLQEHMESDLEATQGSDQSALSELAKRAGLSGAVMPAVFTSSKSGPVMTVLGQGEGSFPACLWTVTPSPRLWFDYQRSGDAGEGLLLHWEADDSLFNEGVAEAMFEAYNRLLEWLCFANWSSPVCELLPKAQREVRSRVNATQEPESGKLLHQGFMTQVESFPRRVALIWGDGKEMTYGELGTWATRIAGLLVSHGMKPGDPVAVTLPKGSEQIAAVLGVLWAGGMYVPIGINQPALRRNRICAKAGIHIAVGGEAERMAGWPPDVKLLTLRDAKSASPLPVSVKAGVQSSAYVIFTSGSTGEPKGVEMSHRAAVNTVEDINARFKVTQADRVLAVSALDFDLSVYDIFGLLSVGGAVVLVEEENRRGARRWLELVHRHGVSVWNSVPALLSMLLLVAKEGSPGPRLALVSGDWVGLDLPKRLKARWPEARFIAMGGATEAAIWSNVFEVTQIAPEWHSIPYGYPLRNQYFRVVDARGRDCPDWVSGELLIGGVGLARGYRGDPEITARQFVEANGERWYHTGDLGRYWPEGTLEFLGRLDMQMKIRGFRIEPNEIEAVLSEHPATEDALVTVRQDKWGDKRLVAYVAGDPSRLKSTELRDLLKAKLPDYMLPSAIVVLKRFPLNSNGKIDRQALPEPGAAKSDKTFIGPRYTLEAQLCAIWENVLGIAPIDVTDNFFEIGGDSFLALRIFIEIERLLDKNLPLAILFQAPTIEKLTLALGEQGWKPTFSPLVAIQSSGSRPPFFCVHGGFGGILFYGQLARCLGPEQPLYGLQAEGLDGGPIEHTSIPAMAAYYLQEVRKVQPQGPYFFGGYSFGGFVAFEMAQQLREAGENVALVVLFDTRIRKGNNSLVKRIRLRWRALTLKARREKFQYVLECVEVVVGRILEKWYQGAPNLFYKAKELGGGAEEAIAKLRAADVVQRTNSRTLAAYKVRPYPGRVTLFRAAHPESVYRFGLDNGWTKFAGGGLQVYEVPGEHQTIFAQPNVRTLAGELDACIRASIA
jgi:yersiniabactin nonribosomal peptide synthetase